MDFTLFDILILFFLLYSIAPTAIIRLGHFGALSSAPRGGAKIALTFDDGPDPRYTPQILEILDRYQVKACFFVIGRQAQAYPELVRQIIQAGHEIGNHGFAHRIVWFLTPLATTREILETNRAIENLTGHKTRYCRPAWGLFNLISIIYYRLKGLKVILWTYMSWDWLKKATTESITEKVLNRIHDGVILVFHDGDFAPGAAHGAPARVVQALPKILEGVREKGLRVVPLADFTPDRKGNRFFKDSLLRIWDRLERIIRFTSGIQEPGGNKSSFFRIALRTYRGKDWLLPGGVLLKKGDRYLELHVNNERLSSLIDRNTSTERMALIVLREARRGLPDLARILHHSTLYKDVKALFAITLLHRATERMGFTAYDMHGIMRPLATLYEKWLLGLYHPGGFRILKSYRDKLEPKYIIMTRQELFSRYLPEEL